MKHNFFSLLLACLCLLFFFLCSFVKEKCEEKKVLFLASNQKHVSLLLLMNANITSSFRVSFSWFVGYHTFWWIFIVIWPHVVLLNLHFPRPSIRDSSMHKKKMLCTFFWENTRKMHFSKFIMDFFFLIVCSFEVPCFVLDSFFFLIFIFQQS